MIKQITCKEIKDYLKKNTKSVLLDVRTQEEWDNVGKPDGDKIGLRTYFLEIRRSTSFDFLQEFKNLNINHDEEILGICKSGERSQISAELLQDADFNVEAINGIKNKLESMYENSTKTKAEKIPELEPEDKWILSMLQNLALNVSQSMDKIRLREALHHILYDFDSELQW